MLISATTRNPGFSPDSDRRRHRPLNVLVADDHPDIREMFRIYLETVGISVRLAEDGRSAVTLARSEHPDVIVMDVNMPRLGGREAVRLLRADEATSDIPIIVLSGAVGRADAEGPVEHVDATVPKPCLPGDVLVVIRRLTERAG
jgi:two-component system, OmpR family, phosphate regulon response regulator PhoB